MTKICLITDIHHGKNKYSGVYNNALPLIKKFNDFCDYHNPNVVIELGDRINDSIYEKDFELASEVASAFTKNSFQLFHINGNHDRANLSHRDNQHILNQNIDSELIDLSDCQLAIWRAETKIEISENFRGIHIRDSDLDWLSKVCEESSKTLLIFSHIPLSGRDQIGNVFFEKNNELAKYPVSEKIRTILRESSNPTFCFSGHIHQNTYTQVDGISHFSQQSLTETHITKGRMTGSMGLIDIDQNLSWQVYGIDQIMIEEPIAKKSWLPPIGTIKSAS